MKLRLFKKPGMTPGFLFLLLCFFSTWKITHRLLLQQASKRNFDNVCHFVSEKAYFEPSRLKEFRELCLKKASALNSETSLRAVVTTFNDVFSTLRTSHLVMYSSSEAEKLWSGQSEETGIESRYVGGELIISKIHKSSPAAKAGLKAGDILVEINGELGNPQQAETESGTFLINRHGVQHTIQLQTASFQRDETPQIIEFSPSTAVLTVPSFRAEFFKKSEWLKQIGELKKYKHIILDLRGNLGGNFVAGLRFLSPLLCQPTAVGKLIKPKLKAGPMAVLPDKLSDEDQIKLVDQSRQVILSTFGGYGCLPASLSVIVDSLTASTAEMVAQALKDFRNVKLYGSTTAGQLLVGVWYPLPEIGPGVRISIPEARFESTKGRTIEGPGVELDEVLYYHLEELQNGEDSWIKTVLKRNVSK
jgi:carboxyl-terminal processing protease